MNELLGTKSNNMVRAVNMVHGNSLFYKTCCKAVHKLTFLFEPLTNMEGVFSYSYATMVQVPTVGQSRHWK